MSGEIAKGVGQALAKAREAKGLTVEAVADQLKLTARQIEAIESEDFGHLPGPVFVRGFVRNYARFLGIEPDGLLATLDVEQKPTETLTAPSEGVKISTSPVRKWLLLPLLFVLVFLLLVAGLYAWLRQGEDALVLVESPPPAPHVTTALPLPPAVPGEAPVVQPPVMPAQGEAAVVTPAVPATPQSVVPPAAPAPAAQPTPAAQPSPAPAAPPEAVQKATPPAPAPASGDVAMLRLAAAEDSWVEIVDATGKRYAKLMTAGSSASLHGQPPFRVVIGNAAQVTLRYNDHDVDLRPFTGEKVARMTLE